MTDDKKSDEKINWNRTVILCIVNFVVVAGTLNIMLFQKNHHIQMSEIPIKKLNEGYAMACTDRDNMEMCLINETGNILVDTQANHNTEIHVWDRTNQNTFKAWYTSFGATGLFNGESFSKSDWQLAGTALPLNESRHTDTIWVIWRGF
ncbi:MAG: hypothetical protein KGI08_08640 [Thaumarchaeota archaeon]|nr:hypothetical protein [Nitrososphaerota archaeon]